MSSLRALFRHPAAAFVAATLLALPAGATWSLVVVNTRTKEVVVASATCIREFDLKANLAVVVVGKGGGAAQALVDTSGVDRRIIFEGLANDWSAGEILDEIQLNGSGSFQQRQFGIVTLSSASTFTGDETFEASDGVTGQDGEILYAIQGNILTGAEVWLDAERAFLGTEGDLGQRVMAAMEAARRRGGDGRCSCDSFFPTSCGSPPPSFRKSSHVGFAIIARVGDKNGGCSGAFGCANGNYHMCLNVTSGVQTRDPVKVMAEQFAEWRAERVGRPDGLLSTVKADMDSLPADGRSTGRMRIQLVDLDGVPLATGGAKMIVRVLAGQRDIADIGDVVDNGDGTYDFSVIAGSVPGTAHIRVKAEDDFLEATLFPRPAIRVDTLEALHCGQDEVHVLEDTLVPFVVNVPEAAGKPYLILGPAAGTAPVTLGVLDENGRAESTFMASAGMLAHLLGQRLNWAAAILSEKPFVTNAVAFTLVE